MTPPTAHDASQATGPATSDPTATGSSRVTAPAASGLTATGSSRVTGPAASDPTATGSSRVTGPAASGLQVCLFHDYRETRQMSMKLYADRLGEELAGLGVPVERVQPPPLVPDSWLRLPGAGRVAGKLDSYVGRFAAYPLRAWRLHQRQGSRPVVYHIVDHGQAYLARYLDPGRTVVTCHDLILLVLAAGHLGAERPPPWATAMLRGIASHLEQVAHVIADSHHTKRDLVGLLGLDPAKISVVFPGLNGPFRPDPELGQAARERWALGDGPVIMHLGANVFYKNLEGCLRILALLRQQGLRARFVRAGHALSPEQLRLAADLGVDDAVQELGAVSGEDAIALYNAADLLLFPSLYEGFGWPPLEAMACGTPVVCSHAGSLAEVVGDAALIADPRDTEGLAAHVASILRDPAVAADLRDRGLAHVGQFSWNRAAEQVLRVYRDVLGQDRPAS